MNKQSINDIKLILQGFYKKGAIDNWPNRDYQLLSFHIHKKTKILVSTSTFKRIFGKIETDKNYTPQQATLNALLEYSKAIEVDVNIKSNESKKGHFIYASIFIVFSILILIIIFKRSSKGDIENNDSLIINLKKTEGKNTSTAFFEIENPINEELKIYFDDFSDTIILSPNQKRVAHFYKFPGVFYPKIYKENKVISNQIPVIVETSAWYAVGTQQDLGIDNTVFPIPKKLLEKKGGYFHATNSDLAKSGVDTTNLSLLRLYNYKKHNIDGDKFSLKVKLRNTVFWPGVQCNHIIVKIIGSKNSIKQYFSKPGCSFWMENIYSEIKKSGSKHDLSVFCKDFSSWKQLNIKNTDKNIEFYINDESIYSISYEKPVGEILVLKLFSLEPDSWIILS